MSHFILWDADGSIYELVASPYNSH